MTQEEQASRKPEVESKQEPAYHTYETNPVPWWVILIWLGFFTFGIVYLLRNLL